MNDKNIITLDEIRRQPELWQVTYDWLKEHEAENLQFLEAIKKKHGTANVVFTGAGTSAYAGDVVVPYLTEEGDPAFRYLSIPTTDIVSNPRQALKNEPTILVSFARSGNSPESVAACELAEKIVDDLYEVVITCAKEGKLAQMARGKEGKRLIVLDERTNDQGFAMTSSFTSMSLAARIFFNARSIAELTPDIDKMIALGKQAVKMEEEVKKLTEMTYERAAFIGSGSLGKLAREASLKYQELAAGKVPTFFDSSLGFRHGPKFFVNENTLVVAFLSNDSYTRQYDLDIVKELAANGIAKKTLTISAGDIEDVKKIEPAVDSLTLDKADHVADALLALPYMILIQFLAVYSALALGGPIDNPSPTGVLGRVVKGVTIYPFDA